MTPVPLSRRQPRQTRYTRARVLRVAERARVRVFVYYVCIEKLAKRPGMRTSAFQPTTAEHAMIVRGREDRLPFGKLISVRSRGGFCKFAHTRVSSPRLRRSLLRSRYSRDDNGL